MLLPEPSQRIKSVSAKLLCSLEERTDFLSQCVNINTSLAQEPPKDAIAALQECKNIFQHKEQQEPFCGRKGSLQIKSLQEFHCAR